MYMGYCSVAHTLLLVKHTLGPHTTHYMYTQGAPVFTFFPLRGLPGSPAPSLLAPLPSSSPLLPPGSARSSPPPSAIARFFVHCMTQYDVR